MRAVVHDRYGPPEVLRLEEVERAASRRTTRSSSDPRDDGHPTDCHIRSRQRRSLSRFFTGLLRPKRRILGMELAGEVEAVGAAVTEFEVGDRVFGVNGLRRARGVHRASGRALPLAHMPAGMTFEEAAAVCDGAIHGARRI